MSRKSIARTMAIAAFLLSEVASGAYRLSGTVVDQRGNGYPGIVVRLGGAASTTAITDTQGRWELSGSSSVAELPRVASMSWWGRELHFHLDRPRRLRAEVVDLQGRRVGVAVDIRLGAGNSRLSWTENRPWLRTVVEWDGERRAILESPGPVLAWRTMDEQFDTLLYTENGAFRVSKMVQNGRDSLGMVQFLARSDAAWDTLVDTRDGNKYRVVTLGGAFGMQTKRQWMAANLRYVPARGSSAPVTAGTDTDGRAYSWATAAALPDSCDTTSCFSQVHEPIQGVCPQGWSLAAAKDWEELGRFVLNQDERLYFGRGIMESVGAIDSRWANVRIPYVPVSEVRDFFGLAIPPTTLEFWTSTPWTDQYNEYEGFSQLWQDFRHNARNVILQKSVAVDEGRKKALLPVRCYRGK